MTKEASEVFDELWSHAQAKLNELAFWKSRVLSAQQRLTLPNQIAPYDPDPVGKQGFSDQRRLDTAFEEYQKRLETQLRKALMIGT